MSSFEFEPPTLLFNVRSFAATYSFNDNSRTDIYYSYYIISWIGGCTVITLLVSNHSRPLVVYIRSRGRSVCMLERYSISPIDSVHDVLGHNQCILERSQNDNISVVHYRIPTVNIKLDFNVDCFTSRFSSCHLSLYISIYELFIR